MSGSPLRTGAGFSLYGFVLSYVAGLLCYKASPRLFFWAAGAAVLFLPVLWLVSELRSVPASEKRLRRLPLKGLALCLCMFVLAALRMEVENPAHNPRHYVNMGREGVYRMRVTEPLQARARTFRGEAEVEALWRDSLWVACEGKVQVYFPKADSARLPACGDRLYVRGKLKPVQGFTGEDGKWFDYAGFLAGRGVYGQCFLRSGEWRAEPWQCAGVWDFIRKKTADLRARLCGFFEAAGMGKAETEVAKALVLGVKVQDGIQEAYRNTGIVHVLAVSGMHLSMFAVMASGLFTFFGRRRWQVWVKFILVNLLVWGYALLTGMSPSVSRAACMFSWVGLGNALGRKVPTERSLAVSAWVLLVCNPFLLQETGFVLSYAAVAGLVFLTPLFMRLWKPANRFLAWVWGMAVSSCAAQAATLPVILHVFGTFPTYFLLANLLVTPVVSVALPWGLATAGVACFWQGGAHILVYGLDFLLTVMNRMALCIGSWRAALLHIPISWVSAVCLSLVAVAACRGLRRHTKTAIEVSLWLLVLVFWIG